MPKPPRSWQRPLSIGNRPPHDWYRSKTNNSDRPDVHSGCCSVVLASSSSSHVRMSLDCCSVRLVSAGMNSASERLLGVRAPGLSANSSLSTDYSHLQEQQLG